MENSKSLLQAWMEAARPRTLAASVSPVLVGCALAYREGQFVFIAALLCLLVALFAQIASNFANDYFDFRQGADTENRVGPERAVAQGWISPKAMLIGTLVALALACLSGCFLILFGGWKLIFVGLAIALAVIAYSAGPYPLSYHGLGDVCVLLFYGIIPVCFTYFVQTLTFSLLIFLLSLAIGFLSVNILVVNNYRDYEEDMAAGKRTTIVLFGRRYGRIIYIVNAALAFIISLPLIINSPWWIMFLFGLLFAMIYFTTKELFLLDGKDLNRTLGHTARNLFFFAVLLSLFLLYDGGAFF